MIMAMEFERLPRESGKAFEAFNLYLNMGAKRSTAAVGKKLGKSGGLIERWCTKFDWAGRVRAFETHLAIVERQATEVAVRAKAAEWVARDEALREQEWKTREEALEMARESIARWRKNKKRVGSLEGIARLLELSSTLGHRATGSPMERVAVTGDDGGPVRVEFEAALRKVYGAVIDVEAEVGPADAEALARRTLKGSEGKL